MKRVSTFLCNPKNHGKEATPVSDKRCVHRGKREGVVLQNAGKRGEILPPMVHQVVMQELDISQN